MRKSSLILCKNMKMDKNYQNVIDYSDTNLVALCRDDEHFIGEDNNYSFIRDRGYLKTSFRYEDCLLSNYIAFQNPEYSNKWFFAFVDKIEYISDNVTYIHYTIDEWSTWYGWWNQTDSFVLREHVNDDTIGRNTYPEGLETGEYIINETDNISNLLGGTYICMGLSEVPLDLPGYTDERMYGGVYSGLTYFVFQTPGDCSKFIKGFDKLAKADAIYNLFLVPRVLAEGDTGVTWYTGSIEGINDITYGVISPTGFSTEIYKTEIGLNNKIDGYTPKNNKLFVFPYNYLYITNNAGSDIVFHYEDYIDNTIKLRIDGTIVPGCSIKLIPTNYKNINNDRALFSRGITAGKLPICSWNSDPYVNWLTSNDMNLSLQTSRNLGGIVSNIANKNMSGVFENTMSILGTMAEKVQHDMVPIQARGNTNSGDLAYANHNSEFTYYKMSIKAEYLLMIDNYFTKFGYQVNRLKKANLTGRQFYNYIQIDASDIIGIGNIPQNSMNIINNIARNGTTIWHNEYDIGNYDLDNQIITQ